jgi:hypothetical protein
MDYLKNATLKQLLAILQKFKGTLTRDFQPLVFFTKQLPLGPETRVKAFFNMDQYSPRKSTL